MRTVAVLVFCLGGFLMSGCANSVHSGSSQARHDVELVNMVNNIGVENAIIAQRTLYPYHFTTDSDELNGLGLSDMAILVRHFREHNGVLNVHRGNVSSDLYQSRILFVLEKMQAAGVETSRVKIEDGMPGGDGMESSSVIKVLEKADEPLTRSSASSSFSQQSR